MLMNHSRPRRESMKEALLSQPVPTALKGKFKVFLETARLPPLAICFMYLCVAERYAGWSAPASSMNSPRAYKLHSQCQADCNSPCWKLQSPSLLAMPKLSTVELAHMHLCGLRSPICSLWRHKSLQWALKGFRWRKALSTVPKTEEKQAQTRTVSCSHKCFPQITSS